MIHQKQYLIITAVAQDALADVWAKSAKEAVKIFRTALWHRHPNCAAVKAVATGERRIIEGVR